MVIGTILYETIPALLLRIFSATDEMLAIGIPDHRDHSYHFRNDDYDEQCVPGNE